MDKQTALIILDSTLILLIVMFSFYMYIHWDEVATINSNPCKACEVRTGNVCRAPRQEDLPPEVFWNLSLLKKNHPDR